MLQGTTPAYFGHEVVLLCAARASSSMQRLPVGELSWTLLDQAGVDCSVRDVAIDELWASDGVFISNSQFGILPARRCGKHAWRPHELFGRLSGMLRATGVVEGPA